MTKHLAIAITLMLIGLACAARLGYLIGKNDSTMTIQQNPLVTAACVKPSTFKPMDDSFGTTTLSATNTVLQYKTLYRAACNANTMPR
jgi:hypothetical protein